SKGPRARLVPNRSKQCPVRRQGVGEISRRKNSAETSRPAERSRRSDCFSRIRSQSLCHRPNSSRGWRPFHRRHARAEKDDLTKMAATLIFSLLRVQESGRSRRAGKCNSRFQSSNKLLPQERPTENSSSPPPPSPSRSARQFPKVDCSNS